MLRWGHRFRTLSFLAFSLYLALLLGTNSLARSGGPVSWFPLWRLPAANNEWQAVGIVGLLPIISITAWVAGRIATRSLGQLSFGWNRVTWPLAGLSAVGLVNSLSCAGAGCNPVAFARLLILLLHLAWIYLYIVNEKPPLFPLVAAVILLQSTVAFGQFALQHDLGLSFLGEARLDPAISGISVVMRGPVRWLRSYGLTAHPNILAGTLVPLLLALPLLYRQASLTQRRLSIILFGAGFVALLTTLSRWGAGCLLLGLIINAIPWARKRLAGRRVARPPLVIAVMPALVILAILFVAIYGDAVSGRAVALDSPVESRSLWERNRDISISVQLIRENPLAGVGLGNYVSAAQSFDEWAQIVHNVPLLLGAELGPAGIIAWLWLVVSPILRKGAFTRYAPKTGLWISFWLLGLLYPGPHPLYELRSALLAGLVAGMVALPEIKHKPL